MTTQATQSRPVNEPPRISVLISTYRNARFVAKKLAEIRAQTWFEHAEFIFIETASPERERELLAPFCAEHPNCRLLTTEDRRTLYEAWNLGWAAARAPLVCYSNMDDAMHPRLLESVVRAMARHQWDACSVLIAGQMATDAQLDDWSPQRLRRLRINSRPGPFTAWRKSLAEKVGVFDAGFVAAGDLDFWSRLVVNQLRVGLVPKILYLYTKSPEQLSKTNHAGRAPDRERLAAKPYPITWPLGNKRRIYALRWVARIFPGLVCLPAKTSCG
jgi:cellulose synthase/poly-beta-1,6-N-acetylglucosamine synthase-like glycosyltransferase